MSFRSEVVRIVNELLAGSKKISELTALPSNVANDDVIEVVRGGQNYKATGSQLPSGGGSGVPTDWNFATSGASPGDFPTDLTLRYYTIDDSVYPFGTEFWTNGSGGWYTK